MYHLHRVAIVAAVLATLIFITSFLPKALNPTPPSPEDEKRDMAWVSSSPYWIDRQLCRWFSVCGVHHMRWDDPAKPRGPPVEYTGELELKRRSLEETNVRSSWEDAGKSANIGARSDKPNDIPDYVLKHAPLVHLYSGEYFWPSDIAEHVEHTIPYVDKEPLNTTEPISLANLYDLNAAPGMVFLTSKEDVEQRPEWLFSPGGEPKPFDEDGGIDGRISPADGHDTNDDGQNAYSEDTTWWDVSKDKPLHRISAPQEHFDRRDMLSKLLRRRLLSGDSPQKPLPQPPSTPGHKPNASGYSVAPAILVLVNKGSGILDAFWFFFYSYNLGQTVLNMRFGNHVGDWEHCMVRFENGVPRAMFLSEHEGGQAFAWSALEKKRVNVTTSEGSEVVERPVIYSAVGSHAMYAFPGDHAYVLPFKMLKDQTDRGPLWDPSLNNYAYFYNYSATPPPPEDDEGRDEEGLSLDESTPYPFNATILEAHANRTNATVTKRDGQTIEPTSLTAASSNPDAPTSWFHFDGPWGDELYTLGDERQWRLFGQYHYVTGPMGPKFKHLGREKVCQKDTCRILYSIEEGKKSSWHD
ncbi:Putative vacuolar protein sorting-associated protein TDA6 [Cytospora mali]|uniref:Vacuolar protein sorting-associated protein TDA6 n=1 Tax=Cytospora mali TaxID=578113 RepID=A0A194V9M0_CYTMA|nr:Putative vacuolar protein sorting-associated protein TDA6 [Valsa mali var. pyri (nom. inval.)]